APPVLLHRNTCTYPARAMVHDKTPKQPSARRAMPVWVYPLGKYLGWIIAIVLLLFFKDALSTVILGLLAASVVACTLYPLLRFLPGPRGLSAVLLGLMSIAMMGALILAFSWPL